MVTTVTTTVGKTSSPQSRAYATITLAEAAIGTWCTTVDLVANDEIAKINCFEDGLGNYDEHVTVDGQTTDSTRYVLIEVDDSARHDGTFASGLRVEPTDGGHAFTISDSFTRVRNFEVQPGISSSNECFRITTGVVGALFENLLLEQGPSTLHDGLYAGNYVVGSTAAPITVRNCYFCDFDRAGIHAQLFTSDTDDQWWDVVNCTFMLCNVGIGWHIAGSGNDVTFTVVNCIGADNTTSDMGDTSTSDHLATNDSSANNFGEDTGTAGDGAFFANTAITLTDNTSPGAGSWAIVVDATGTTPATVNLLLVDDADNDVQGAGVGPSSNALVALFDAIGNTRSDTTCDAGFHEVTGGVVPDTVHATYAVRYEHTPAPNTSIRM